VAPDRATAARQGVDVTRVREVLAKVARRNAERQALLRQAKDSFDEPAGAGPAQAPPEPAASPAPPPSNSFLPPGFQGIRRRLVPQKAPVVADRPPLSTGSQTTLPVERERTPSGLSDKGEGPGGGGAGGRGGRGG